MPNTATEELTAAPTDDPVRAALGDEAIRRRLLVHARAVGRGPALDHEDLVQTALGRAWAKRTGYDPDAGTVTAWLAGFVRHVAREWLRQKSPASAAAGQLDAVPRSADADLLELDDLRATAHRCLACLAEPFRTAVELRVMRDWDYDALAARLGTSVVNARQLVSRGLSSLRTFAAKEDRS
jgi:RNA polymerase sigma-70 factor (ECF subfamily)